MTYILVSYFNSNNLGDVLLSNLIYEEIKERAKVIPCSFEGDFVVPEDKLYVNKIIKRVSNKLIPCRTEQFWNRLEKLMIEVDGLIIGGGNMLMDIETYSTIPLFERYINLAEKYDKPIIVPFVGVGPINNPKLVTKLNECLNKCKYVSVRDKRALDYIREKQAYCTFDPAFLLKQREGQVGKVILVNIIDQEVFSNSKDDSIFNFYIELIKQLLLRFNEDKIILVITEKRDYKIAKCILKAVKGHKRVSVSCPSTGEELINMVSNARFVCAARMHLMIVAYTQGIPFVGFKWQSKIDGFFENIQMSECCYNFSVNEIDKIINCIHKSDLQAYRERISSRRKYIQEDIRQSFNKIGELIYET